MAVINVPPNSFPTQPPIISSEQISRYAELSALVSQLEAQQKELRSQILTLRSAGAEQDSDCPYLLAFVDQERRTVDWKTSGMELAGRVLGMEKAVAWKLEIEAAAPVQQITQVRVKPNPAFAAGLAKPVGSVRNAAAKREGARFGD